MSDLPSTSDLEAAFKNLCSDAELGRPIRCVTCGLEFKPEQLHDQFTAYLERKFSDRQPTPAVRRELVAEISPWRDRFVDGEDLCFDCGTAAEATSS